MAFSHAIYQLLDAQDQILMEGLEQMIAKENLNAW